MPKSVTLRNGAGSRRHNIRDYQEMPGHVDPSLSKDNVVLVDKPLWQAYNEIFGEAIEQYNAKQTRNDRKYKGGAQAYLNEIKREKGDMARKPFYETFVQIGDRNDTGLTNCAQEREALLEYMRGFQDRNPNLRVIGAYLHADEPNGTIHGHIDWVPVATGYKRGFGLQNGLKRALAEQGFTGTCKKYNAYLGWQESERQALRQICREHGIEPAESKGEGREWADKERYIAEQQLEACKQPAADVRDLDDLAERARKTLTGKVVRSKADDEVLRKAAAHGASVDYHFRTVQRELAAAKHMLKNEESKGALLRDDIKRLKGKIAALEGQLNDLRREAAWTNEFQRQMNAEAQLKAFLEQKRKEYEKAQREEAAAKRREDREVRKMMMNR